YRLLYSQDCTSCRDSYFLQNCTACVDCIGCINQRHKQYMIFNKQYAKEEYEKLKNSFNLKTTDGVEKLRKKCGELSSTQPRKCVSAENNEFSSGDHLFNSKNAFYCFDSVDIEDCAYCAKLSLGVKSSMDYNSWGNKSELMYQCSSCGDNCYNLKFCINCQANMRDCEYCVECFSCTDCFGCVGLKREHFCILNKKYDEKTYVELKEKIIGHMGKTGEYGEFFPVNACSFGYNETMAMDAFPLTKEQALASGMKWHEEDHNNNGSINLCACGKNFQIISQEAEFYKKLQIPTPGSCPGCRHKSRMAKRSPLKMVQRACGKCKTIIETNYPSEGREKIYCEKCYLEEVY
ncbi:MAG: hypothetical protein AAB592_03815, partial [Patescibacteria group bacterium]